MSLINAQLKAPVDSSSRLIRPHRSRRLAARWLTTSPAQRVETLIIIGANPPMMASDLRSAT